MSSQTGQYPTLDHIVILVSHDTLLGLSDRLQNLFTLAPGGNHADGLTANKLVLLEDGVYIEFIAFLDNVDPNRRKKHRWGNLKEGTIVDWAFTLPSEDHFGPIRKRVLDANASLSYEELVAGGRRRPDGAILEWTVSAARDSRGNVVPGPVPFWCLDKTPRELRVPYEVEPHLTKHPSGVRGVASLSLSVPSGEASDLMRVYEAIYGPAVVGQQDWPFEVPSGSTVGRHAVSLTGGTGETTITLTLSGPKREQIEILPGLAFQIE